jgi:antitoxin HicB
MLSYPIKLTPDDNDTLFATSPDFPELKTFGDDRDDALMHAVDALETAIAYRIAHREDIPRPSRGRIRATLPTQTAMKVFLYQAMREQGLRKADLARRLTWHAPQIDRLFDLKHASRVDQMDAAFAAIGRRLEIGLGETV